DFDPPVDSSRRSVSIGAGVARNGGKSLFHAQPGPSTRQRTIDNVDWQNKRRCNTFVDWSAC
ncbi:unnamed protein product, partial [Amoebophrya sp. A25]